MLGRNGVMLAVGSLLALGSVRAQSALTPPRQERLRRPVVNSQDVGHVALADSLRVPRTALVTRGGRPALRLALPRIPPPVASVASTTQQPSTVATSDSGPRLTRPAQGVAWARVTYISGASVYLDAGTRHGLRIGTHLDVMRGTTFVAELVVEYVSSTRASSRVARSTLAVAVGDSARYDAVRTEAPIVASARSDTGVASSAARRSHARPIRGRIGVRYLRSDPGLGSASVIVRPAFDIRADGHEMNGTALGLMLDVRAYQDRRATNGSGNVTRVYQAAVEVQPPGSGARVAVGRQFSTALGSIGIFDGVALDLDRKRWSAGALAGSQPEPTRFGLSGDIREYGAYFQLHNVRNSSPLWTSTLGAIASYNHGEIDREFAYLQSTFTSRRFSFYATQEVDVNRGWKADAEGSAVLPTSSFAMMRVAVTQDFQLNAGYDSRRSVRLYRDFITPEIEFDDSFRRGAWGGATLSALGHIRVSGDARRSSGGTAGSSQSYTGMLSVFRLTPLQVGLRGRGTAYKGDLANGSLMSAAVEVTPFGSLHLEATTGLRSDRTGADSAGRPSIRWNEITADLGVGRSVYILFSAYRENGSLSVARTSQAYVALSYRF